MIEDRRFGSAMTAMIAMQKKKAGYAAGLLMLGDVSHSSCAIRIQAHRSSCSDEERVKRDALNRYVGIHAARMKSLMRSFTLPSCGSHPKVRRRARLSCHQSHCHRLQRSFMKFAGKENMDLLTLALR